MATIAAPKALNFKTSEVDFSGLRAAADESVKSAALNYELYAQTAWAQMSQAAYQNNSTDPLALGVALKNIATEILPDDMPDAIKNKMMSKFYIDSLALASKAVQNQDVARDQQNQLMAQANIANLTDRIEDDYIGVLKYNMSTGEDKRPIDVEIFNQNAIQLAELANIKDINGKPVFNDTQRKDFTTLQGRKLNAFQKFFDGMLLNSPEEAKDYYTKFMLNTEEYMGQNAMGRETFEKAKAYANRELKRAGEDMKNPVFNRTRYETAKLQTAYLDEKIDLWQKNKLITEDVAEILKSNNVATDPIDIGSQETFIRALESSSEILQNADETVAGNEARFKAYAQALQGFSSGFNKNIDEDDQKGVITLYSRALIDGQFSESLKPIFAESAIRDALYAPKPIEDINKIKGIEERGEALLRNIQLGSARKIEERADKLAMESATNVAARYAQSALRAAVVGNYEAVPKILQEGNRQVIRTRAQNKISPEEFDRLEMNLRNGMPAIYKDKYEFKGYSSTSPIFVRKI